MSSQRHLAHRQRGVATVFIAMVLLLAMGLIAIYTSRSAIVEQRISANEVRAKQALAAATAGLDHALAQLRVRGSNIAGLSGALVPASGGVASNYRALFVAATTSAANLPICGDAPTSGVNPNGATAADARSATLLAVSCGWSDDNTSVQRVMQLLERRGPFNGPPATPLVTRGGIALGGNPAVFNYFNDLTVWSGETLDKNGSPSSTFIRNIADPDYVLPDPSVDYRDIGNGASARSGISNRRRTRPTT